MLTEYLIICEVGVDEASEGKSRVKEIRKYEKKI